MKILIRTIEILLFVSIIVILAIKLPGCLTSTTPKKKVGIILPIEHASLNAIVNSFKENLHTDYPSDIDFKVANAQGDMNVLRAIIQQMKAEHYDLIVPIGVDTTQMTLALIQKIPVVSLASELTQEERSKLKTCNVAVVHDEISIAKVLKFVRTVYPNLTQLTLLHSPSNKIFTEIKTTVNAGKKIGIEITPMLINTLSDLYTTVNNLPANTQGIFLLKDNLIVSGIGTIANAAKKYHIPVISSDEGSVQNGAGIALGVHESEIGKEGAKLALQILNGSSACDLPIVQMDRYTVFFNKKSLADTNQSYEQIEQAASSLNYQIESLTQDNS